MKLSKSRINLLGDQVAWGKGAFLTSVISTRDLLPSSFVAAAAEVAWRGDMAQVGIAVVRTAMTMYALKAVESAVSFGAAKMLANKNLYIETRGDLTPPTLHKYGLMSEVAKFLYGAATVGIMFVAAMDGKNFGPMATVMDTIFFAPSLSRMARGFYRWNQVSKGNWVVVDEKGPPPQTVAKMAPQRSQLVFGPQALPVHAPR